MKQRLSLHWSGALECSKIILTKKCIPRSTIAKFSSITELSDSMQVIHSDCENGLKLVCPRNSIALGGMLPN